MDDLAGVKTGPVMLEQLADALDAWLHRVRNNRPVDPSIVGLSDMARVARTNAAHMRASQARADALQAEVERLRGLLLRGSKIVPLYCSAWHAEARAALQPQEARDD
jgi:hypothetical protein